MDFWFQLSLFFCFCNVLPESMESGRWKGVDLVLSSCSRLDEEG